MSRPSGMLMDPAAAARATEEQARMDQMKKKALANVKPFLLALFDDKMSPTEEDEAAAGLDQREAAVRAQREGFLVSATTFVPSGGYEDSLKRELAKPYKLNFTPSTDRLPLATKTCIPTFTRYPEAGEATDSMLLVTKPKRFRDTPGNVEWANNPYHRELGRTGATPPPEASFSSSGGPLPTSSGDGGEGERSQQRFNPNTAAHIPSFLESSLHKARTVRSTQLSDTYTPYHGVYHNEEKLLRDAHLDSLMRTVQEGKAVPTHRDPVVWW